MSRIRGLLLGGDTEQLIVVATQQEVRKFTLNEAVDLLAVQGWRMSPADAEHGWNNYVNEPPAAQIILRTSCGCERLMVVQRPLPDVIRLPIATSLGSLARNGQPQHIAMSVRRFRMKGRERRDVTVSDWHSLAGPLSKNVERYIYVEEPS